MKKQYSFLVMIVVILYIFYLIIADGFQQYKRNSDLKYIKNLIKELKVDIKNYKSTIKYQQSLAFNNKILKEQQSFKNLGEKVIYLTTEDKYNKYTKEIKEVDEKIGKIDEKKLNLDEMSIYEKWNYFLFSNK